MTQTQESAVSEFDEPPAEPLGLLKAWFEQALAAGVREPGAVALATVTAGGEVSNRTVQTIRITPESWVFTSHAGSQKGRDIEATGTASAVFYWREAARQLVVTGTVRRLPDAACDELWFARDPSTHPMSVAAAQSEPLEDEEALRAKARQLADSGEKLDRPQEWLGYELIPTMVEFWQAGADRLHRRLRYDRAGDAWTSRRLQP